jgi:hypothetical protein
MQASPAIVRRRRERWFLKHDGRFCNNCLCRVRSDLLFETGLHFRSSFVVASFTRISFHILAGAACDSTHTRRRTPN